MECPFCHYPNPEDTNFCGKCGSPLSLQGETAVYTPDTMRAFLQEIQPGTVLAERYEVIESLGRGGMGTVFKVRDRKIREIIALKLIRPEIAVNAATRERFRNEIKLARKITHKNVCRMYDMGEDGPLHFITMEYIAGQDLKRMMRMTGQLSPGSAVTIAKQAAEGLAEAHRLGIVHRDLKPQNIMIDPDGQVKIMDFGIARSIYEKGVTVTGVLVGSPEYMSPEQAEAREVDRRTDIYALGVILYEMVTGRVPFTGDTPLSIAIKHKHEDPADPGDLNALVPPDLSRVILRCLEKSEARRYPDMAGLLEDLSRIEKGIPTVERVVPRRKTLVDRPITLTFKPRRVLIPLLGFIVVAAAGILIGRHWIQSRKSPAGVSFPWTDRIGRPDESLSQRDSFVYHPEGRVKYVVPTPAPPAAPDQLEEVTAGVPQFIQKMLGAATELSGEEISELATIQGLMRFLRIDPSEWVKNSGDSELDKYASVLEKIISALQKESPQKEEWGELRRLLNRGRELVRGGRTDEAEKLFDEAETRINRLYSGIMIRQRAERMKASARRSYDSSHQGKSEAPPLDSLAALLSDADELNSRRKYESAAALYQLAAEAGSAALHTDGDKALAEAISKMAGRRRLVLSEREKALAGIPGALFAKGWETEKRASAVQAQKQYREAANLFLQACALYEKARMSLL